MFFRCPGCGRNYGDPLYHGPAGHAPARLCFDCWASEWGVVKAMIDRESGRWREVDAALFLLCQGFTREEAAAIVGVHRNTVSTWISRMRRNSHEIPEWLCTRWEESSRSKYTEGENSHDAARR